jgi:hypothetical protein
LGQKTRAWKQPKNWIEKVWFDRRFWRLQVHIVRQPNRFPLAVLGIVLGVFASTIYAQDFPGFGVGAKWLGGNQIQLWITNAMSFANYEIQTRQSLDSGSSWTTYVIGGVGQTNFTIQAAPISNGFFRAVLGASVTGLTSGAGVAHTNYLGNRDMGLQTTRQLLSDVHANPRGYPSNVTVWRYTLNEIMFGARSNGTAGQFDFTYFDNNLKRAADAGVRLNIRIIPYEPGYDNSDWIANYPGTAGWRASCDDNSNHTTEFYPDYNNPVVQNIFRTLFQGVANHVEPGYNVKVKSHPGLGFLDVGSMGLYGEWHHSGTHISNFVNNPTIGGTNAGQVPMPALAAKKRHIDDYIEAFGEPASKYVCAIDDAEGFDYATVQKRTGYRADGFGHRTTGNDYHMTMLYPARLGDPVEGNRIWLNRPVYLEPYNSPVDWGNDPSTYNFMLSFSDATRKYHASAFNGKSGTLEYPTNMNAAFDQLLHEMGYRYVCTDLRHPRSVPLGASVTFEMTWENRGYAPNYGSDQLALKLSSGTNRYYLATGVRADFLPVATAGPFNTIFSRGLPGNMTPGLYTVSVGIVSSNSTTLSIACAMSSADSEGYYPLTTLGVGAGNPSAAPATTRPADLVSPFVLCVEGQPSAGGVYTNGNVVFVSAKFSEEVIVTAAPRLALSLDAGGSASAVYSTGSGSRILSFAYTVGASDRAALLSYPGSSALSLNGGSIKDRAGNNAVLTLPNPGTLDSLSADSKIVIGN